MLPKMIYSHFNDVFIHKAGVLLPEGAPFIFLAVLIHEAFAGYHPDVLLKFFDHLVFGVQQVNEIIQVADEAGPAHGGFHGLAREDPFEGGPGGLGADHPAVPEAVPGILQLFGIAAVGRAGKGVGRHALRGFPVTHPGFLAIQYIGAIRGDGDPVDGCPLTGFLDEFGIEGFRTQLAGYPFRKGVLHLEIDLRQGTPCQPDGIGIRRQFRVQPDALWLGLEIFAGISLVPDVLAYLDQIGLQVIFQQPVQPLPGVELILVFLDQPDDAGHLPLDLVADQAVVKLGLLIERQGKIKIELKAEVGGFLFQVFQFTQVVFDTTMFPVLRA